MSETADETTTEIAILVEHDEHWTLSPVERKYYVTLYPKHLAVCLSLRFFSYVGLEAIVIAIDGL